MRKEEGAVLSWDFPLVPREVRALCPERRRCAPVLARRSEAMSRWGDQAGLLLIPPLLLALQLIVVWPRLPSAHRGGTGEQGEAVFSVISIEPETRQRGQPARGAGVRQDEKEGVQRGDGGRSEGLYEDENEMNSRQMGPNTLEMQPWVANMTFAAELNRILNYINNPQLNCSKVFSSGEALEPEPTAAPPRWLLCAEEWLLPTMTGPCIAYSFSMDGGDRHFQSTVSRLGCEVHSFDPSSSNTSGGHLGNSLASNGGGVVSRHKMWLEWRGSRKSKRKMRRNLGSVSLTLADIMAALGHHTVHFLYADLLSAEWRVFQNWIESGTLQHVHHVVATVNLQWAGFEVAGTDQEVLLYWFSVLQGLQASGLRLVHSSAGKGHTVLKRTLSDAHSSYTLSWVNTSL
ncbi:probable methyltransferase-like protein 24 [Boleophthalmus pectinirostris]|uniref:probable methyltransferase-like protein 24 n=1 Tax=Boleophthalmus pectinirostris TaxID=150288 RepID=UPI00242E8B96|nr:probable methyltransferase-like protein 24 [Boleophthalmus pectinirostris]